MLTDEQFAWWLVGLVDGEGHFGIVRQSSAERPGPYYRCVFRVALAASDRAVLEQAQRRTGWGKLYQYAQPRPLKDGRQQQDYVVWTVTTKEVAIVAEFFDAHPLQSKKAQDFAAWAPAARAQATRRRGKRDESIAAVLAGAYDELRAMRGGA